MLKADTQILTENASTAEEENNTQKNTFTDFSNEIEELISNKPPLIVRGGTLIFFFLLLMLVVISWFIRYPDIVTAKAKLSSFNAAKPVICMTAGNLVGFTVKEGDIVHAAAIIGIIENTADVQAVLELSASLDTLSSLFSKNNGMIAPGFLIQPYKNFGGLQQAYQVFSLAFIAFTNYRHGGFYEKKKLILENDLSAIKRLNDHLHERKIAAQINEAILTNETRLNEKREAIMELENAAAEQPLIFQQALNTFKAAVDNWKQKYLLIAPVSGKVSLAGFLPENHQLTAGQAVCFINPNNSEYFAETFIPQENFAKVKKGEKVLLKFASYPSHEYGSVTGKLDFVSSIPTDTGYLARIILPGGLKTNYNKKIHYNEGLTAKAEIITNNRRLLERLYYNFIKQADQ